MEPDRDDAPVLEPLPAGPAAPKRRARRWVVAAALSTVMALGATAGASALAGGEDAAPADRAIPRHALVSESSGSQCMAGKPHRKRAVSARDLRNQ